MSVTNLKAKTGFFKRLCSEALPFVARSPEMKVEWLIGVFARGGLTCVELAPYMHLLLSEHDNEKDEVVFAGPEQGLRDVFRGLGKGVISEMIRCTEIYDIPILLSLVGSLSVDDAVVVLCKQTPPYEKKSLFVLDQVFQAVYGCGADILDRATEKMRQDGVVPAHFDAACERFKEILMDEKILCSLYPQAKH